jgi:hypothetical protein
VSGVHPASYPLITERRPRHGFQWMMGIAGAVRGLLAIGGTTRLLLAIAVLLHTHRQYLAFRVACGERVSCVNACRMCSSKSSFFAKSSPLPSVEFLAGITSCYGTRINP